MELPDLLAIARGDAPADLVLRNARLVNVFSGQIEATDIVLAGGRVAALGPDYAGHTTVDLQGQYVAPGLIDAHVHIESSLCTVPEFTQAVLPRGTTTVVIDPHEVANVLGLEGIGYMLEMAKYGPLTVYVNVPSCVPATHMATAGARLEAEQLVDLRHNPWVIGLGEVMNYPGVIQGDAAVLRKLHAFQGRPIDGHAPGMRGRALQAYVAAGIGSDHECTTVAEAAEKLRLGLYVLIREATNAHNLRTLLPLVTPANSRRICFCTDDRQPGDLLDEGGIDFMVRTAIERGISPVTAIQMATLNTSEWFGLHDAGAVAPGRRADLIVFDSLEDFQVRQVYRAGQLVAADGEMLPWLESHLRHRPHVRASMNVDWERVDFSIPAAGRRLRVIGAIPDQIVTEHLVMDATVLDGAAVADPARDLAKMAVIERHLSSGHVGLGFIARTGLRRGAMAGSVAHDHHNLVVIGADDQSMHTAARAVGSMKGGLAVALGDQVVAQLPLPVLGLMSDRPIAEVRRGYDELLNAAHALGASAHDPFMAMSFSALEVIPHLKLTDLGLVDVDAFAIVGLWE
jgi:adenine deaminase